MTDSTREDSRSGGPFAGATRLRQLLRRGQILALPLIHDALSARIAARCGYDAVFLSGYGFSAGYLGLPDAGFTTFTELLLAARNLVNAVPVPVIVDIDTGYGNAISVKRVIREFAQVGVAGVLLEDQVAPKRSEFVAGAQVLPLDEAVGKFRAAVDARNAVVPDFVLIARTDVRVVAGGSLDEAIQRGNAYADAGADVIFVAAPQSVDEIKTAMSAIKAPAFCPIAGIRPYPSLELQQEWGMAMTLYGASHRVAAKAVWDYYQAMKVDAAAQDTLTDSLRGHPLENFHAFIGFPELQEDETRYLPADELQRRYDGSIGFKG
jgi:2-methylisocitrate lyase-like PEP mutase family enzyme